VIEFSDWAIEIIEKADEAARRLNPDARVRIARAGSNVMPQLTDAPDDGDATVEVGSATIFIEAGIDGLIDIQEPHDRIVLRPAGSRPNVRAPH
jgi:hypothetical protein